MKHLLSTLVIFMLLVAPLQASQDGIIVRQATVFTDASSVSGRVGKINAGSKVSVFGRKGGWKEIFSEKEQITGWVRSYQVREGNYTQQVQVETEEDSRGFLSGLASFSRKASRFFTGGGSKTSSGTATIGVRGLSEEEIKSAQPDFDELAKMQRYASNQLRLGEFILKGQLNARKVRHVRAKKKKKTGTSGGGSEK